MKIELSDDGLCLTCNLNDMAKKMQELADTLESFTGNDMVSEWVTYQYGEQEPPHLLLMENPDGEILVTTMKHYKSGEPDWKILGIG